MGAFHAYDIRGIYGVDFNKDDVVKIGYFFPKIFKIKKILVGRDTRTSSDEIHDALIQGLLSSGCDVYDTGLATTPSIYWGTAKYDFDASIMITASHNPKEYNGLKFSGKNATPIGYDDGLNKIEKLIQENEKIEIVPKGTYQEFNFSNEYVDFLKKYLKKYLKQNLQLNFTIDCSNGMAGLYVHEIFTNQAKYMFDDLDGTFPNHEANPLEEKNLKDLKKIVLEQKNDFGMIFDGDADRVMFVDEKGKFISPDLMIGLLGHYFLEERNQKGKVLQDIRTSKSVAEYLEPMGGEIVMWRVGRAYAATKLREIDGIYGGELAGHYYFRDFYYSDSGLLASILITNIISDFIKKGYKVSEIIAKIKKYENSGEINFKINHKLEAMNAVKDYFINEQQPIAFYDFDGYRLDYNDWWFNIRPSNTEPYLRLIVEAKNNELLEEKLKIINNIISNYE